MIHTTIGVYPDGSRKVNGVSSENLADHIQYNIRFRPGRAFFVDGKCIYRGISVFENIEEEDNVEASLSYIKIINNLKTLKIVDTIAIKANTQNLRTQAPIKSQLLKKLVDVLN